MTTGTNSEFYKDPECAILYDTSRRGHPKVISKLLALHPVTDPGYLADVGCGTGNETSLLVRATGCKVIGIDLSMPMLKIATVKCQGLLIPVCADASDGLPLPDGSLTYVLSSFFHHHVPSSLKCFEGIFRVLQSGGRFVLLGATLEQALDRPLMNFFPSMASIEKTRYESRGELLDTFWRSGFVEVSIEEIEFETRMIDDRYLEKVRGKMINSALMYLSENEFKEGLQHIAKAIPEKRSFTMKRSIISGIRPHCLSV
jgi:ubiquinone/menaquinone biosynthesis C-methylase UbiE